MSATENAKAQSSDGQTAKQSSTELRAANQRSQAAIRLAKDLQNNLGKYLQPEGLLIGANPPPPPIRQDRGTGDGGLPTEVIKDAVDSGMLGNIYQIRVQLTRRRGIPGMGGWFTTKAESGGGGLIDIGVHFFDLAMWLSGYWNPTAVSAKTYAKFGSPMEDYNYVSMWAGPRTTAARSTWMITPAAWCGTERTQP